MSGKKEVYEDEPIHAFFGLSYAAYLVLPRSILQSMPLKWQKRFVDLIHEMEENPKTHCPLEGTYQVYLRDEKGRFMPDYFKNYERGRRNILKER